MNPANIGPSDVKVSVAMITYNHEQFIAQAIESVLMQQTDFTLELIIGEDCSTDGTRAIARTYGEHYSERIRLLLPGHNLGMMPNFVATMNACRGQYIAILEGDDYWTDPLKLQKQMDFLEAHPKCSLCFHSFERREEGGGHPTVTVAPLVDKQHYGLDDVYREYFIHTATVMFRNVPGLFPEWGLDVQPGDWLLYALNAERGKLCHIKNVMSVYRIHPSGAWSPANRVWQLEQLVRLYDKIKYHLPAVWNPDLRSLQAGRQFALALEYYLQGSRELAVRSLAAASPAYTSSADEWLKELLVQVWRLEDENRDDAARDLMHWVCETLRPAPGSTPWTRRLWSEWYASQAFRADARGDRKSAWTSALRALLADRSVIHNRGLASVALKAWMGTRAWNLVHNRPVQFRSDDVNKA